jgi:hypothetical protein
MLCVYNYLVAVHRNFLIFNVNNNNEFVFLTLLVDR